ncbi:MAG: hypothetical protein JNJ54_27455, partial [Myxococcaceae bacterium]|nr:hypothetical protein [Myxococcaceae bacterium]
MRAIVIAVLALVACSEPEREPVGITRQALGAPVVTTNAATLVTSSSATLNGSGNPNEAATAGYFRYSTTSPGTCNDLFGTRLPSSSFSDVSLGSGTSAVPYSLALSSLTPGTTYYFCALARNSFGTSVGAVLSFTTLPAAPTVNTGASSNRTGTTATLNGSANPGGAATTAW